MERAKNKNVSWAEMCELPSSDSGDSSDEDLDASLMVSVSDHTPFGPRESAESNEVAGEMRGHTPSPHFFILPVRASSATLYSYLIDSRKFVFTRVQDALSIWRHVHTTLVRTVQERSRLGMSLDGTIFRAYMKFRHNIFACLVLLSLGIIRPIGTDEDMSRFGSKQTPDIWIKGEGRNLIVEVTVGRSRETIEYQKSSDGLGGGKYDDLIKCMQEQLGEPVEYRLVYMVLGKPEDSDWRGFLEELKVSAEDQEVIQEFESISLTDYDVIASHVFLSRINVYTTSAETKEAHDRIYEVLNKGYQRPPIPKVYKINQEYIEKLKKNRDHFLNILTGRDKNEFFGFYFDADKSFLKILPDKKGISVSDLTDALFKYDFGTLIQITQAKFRGKESKLIKVPGTIPVTCLDPIKEIEEFSEVFLGPSARTYNSTSPNDPEHWDVKECGATYPGDKVDVVKGSVLFEPDYLLTLVNTLDHKVLEARDSKRDLLANNTIDEDHLRLTRKKLEEALLTENLKTQVPRRIKQCFIYPVMTGTVYYSKTESVNIDFLESIIKVTTPYTAEVLRKCKEGIFVKRVSIPEELKPISDEINEIRSVNCVYKRQLYPTGKLPKHSEFVQNPLATEEMKSSMKREQILNSERTKQLSRLTNLITTDKTVKIPNGKKSIYRQSREQETSHYGMGKGYEGYGIMSEEERKKADRDYRCLFNRLTSRTSGCSTELHNEPSNIGPEFLKEHKNFLLSQFKGIKDSYINSFFGKNNELIARLCYTLMKLSTTTSNGENCTLSNLGYQNVLLVVRGGPKLFKTGRSRMYRLAYPVDEDCIDSCGFSEGSGYTRFVYHGNLYVLSPWSQMHEDIVKNGMSFYRSAFSHLSVTMSRCGIETFRDLKLMNFIPFLLAYHNKRKTEGAMHNMRYFIVNQLGENSTLAGVTSSFAFFNFTYFDAWLKSCVLFRMDDVSIGLKKFKDKVSSTLDIALAESDLVHLITGEPIDEVYELVDTIYSTYLMVKAPVQKSVEQAANLLPILQDIEDFHRLHGLNTSLSTESLHFSILDMDVGVFKDDFLYDPVFCQYLGHYTAGLLGGNHSRSKINELWEKSLGRSFTDVANANGLRGMSPEDFFNKKGYEIVYTEVKKILKEDGDVASEMESICTDYDLKVASGMIDKSRMSVGDYCNSRVLDKVVFHVVEKVQRALNREVMVMNLMTKSFQKPLEDFFKKLCQLLHNEVISIPSSKRGELLHGVFYEGAGSIGSWVKSVVKYTLDCRRWAPHAVFQKYIHFIHGLAPVLPQSFLEHFYCVGEAMIERKYFVTRDYVRKVLAPNKTAEKLLEHLKKSTLSADAYDMKVEFSFVMGIYNFLSSLMHAANQTLASEVIMRYHIRTDNSLVVMNMFAHSDDSCGDSHHENLSTRRSTLVLYDFLLKAANHMKSVKKCVVTFGVYLEFLSILYVCNQLLSAITKFSGTIPFTPSDKGLVADMQFTQTQMMEMMTHGATFAETYLLGKLTEKHILDLYSIFKVDVDRPSTLMGSLDQHPMEVLIGGDDAETYKHYRYNKQNMISWHKMLSKLVDTDGAIIPKIKWKMGSFLNKKLKDKFPLPADDIMSSWTIKNGSFNALKPSYLWWLSKLHDPTFYSSMINEPSSRRLARIYGAMNREMNSSKVSLNMWTINAMLEGCKGEDGGVDDTFDQKFMYLGTTNSELGEFYDACEITSMDMYKVRSSNLTLKPTTTHLRSNTLGSLTVFSDYFVTWAKEKKYLPLYGQTKSFDRDCNAIKEFITNLGIEIGSLGPEDLSMVARKVIGKDSNIRKILTYTSSNDRYINSLESCMNLMKTNSVYKKEVAIDTVSVRRIDRYKDMLAARVPKSVITYYSTYWVSELCNISGLDVDIFADGMDPKIRLPKLYSEIPVSWKTLVQSIKTTYNDLKDLSYWAVWSRQQQRFGTSWVGKGEFYVHMPEVRLLFFFEGSELVKTEVDTNVSKDFDHSTSWFFSSVIFQILGGSKQMIISDYISPNEICLGISGGTSNWGIGMASRYTQVIPLQYNPSLRASMPSTGAIERRGKDILHKGRKLTTFFNIEQNSPVGIREHFDMGKVRLHKRNSGVIRLAKRISLVLGEPIAFNTETILATLPGTTIYKIFFEFPDRDNLLNLKTDKAFLVSLIDFKKKNPDFKFPDMDSLAQILQDPMAARLPLGIINSIESVGIHVYSPEIMRHIQAEVMSSLDETFDYQARITQCVSNYGNKAVMDVLTINILKDKRMVEASRFAYFGGSCLKLIAILSYYLDMKKDLGNYNSSIMNLSRSVGISCQECLTGVIQMAILHPILSQTKSTGRMGPVKVLLQEVFEDGEEVCFNLGRYAQGIWANTDFGSLSNRDLLDIFSDLLYCLRFVPNIGFKPGQPSGVYNEVLKKREKGNDFNAIIVDKSFLSQGLLGLDNLGEFNVLKVHNSKHMIKVRVKMVSGEHPGCIDRACYNRILDKQGFQYLDEDQLLLDCHDLDSVNPPVDKIVNCFYKKVVCGSWYQISSLAGSAEVVLLETPFLTPDIEKITRAFEVHVRINTLATHPKTRLMSRFSYLLVLKPSKNWTVRFKDFEILEESKYREAYLESPHYKSCILTNGGKIDKETLCASEISLFSDEFLNLEHKSDPASVMDQFEKLNKAYDLKPVFLEMGADYQTVLDKINRFKRDRDEQYDDQADTSAVEGKEEPLTLRELIKTVNLDDIIKASIRQIGTLNSLVVGEKDPFVETATASKLLSKEMRGGVHRDYIEVLQDPVVISELAAINPDLLEIMLDRTVCLSRDHKKYMIGRLRQSAKSSGLTSAEFKRRNCLLFFFTCIFNSIKEGKTDRGFYTDISGLIDKLIYEEDGETEGFVDISPTEGLYYTEDIEGSYRNLP